MTSDVAGDQPGRGARWSRPVQRLVLTLIRIGRRLFYNTPVHRSLLVNRLYRRLFHAAYPPGQLQDVTYLGHSFHVPTRDLTILPSLLNQQYEAYEFEVMTGLAEPGTVFADVGANIGLFAVVMGAAIGPGGHVYAFEPEPENHALLRRNLARNGIAHVTVEQMAVGAGCGTLTLYVESGSIGTHTLVAGIRADIEHEIDVATTDLDSYFQRAGRWPDLVKVDVEGYEPHVFQGATETLSRARYLFFEFVRRDLERQGFRADDFGTMLRLFPYLYRIDENRRRLLPVGLGDLATASYANVLASKRPLGAVRHEG